MSEIPTLRERQQIINAGVYQRPGVDAQYLDRTLTAMETAALLEYQPALYGRDMLDIGVGAGRTSRFLAPLTRSYLGIDYSVPMLKTARAQCPGVHFQLLDMRELATLGAGRFDFTFAPNNVVDATSSAGREQVLLGVAQVLRPGGLFMFSSHNLRWTAAFGGPRLHASRNPVTFARNLQRYMRQVCNHNKVRRYRRVELNHAILNDEGHDFSLLHYYLDRFEAARQLDAVGFELLGVIDEAGQQLADQSMGSASASLMYVARRRGGALQLAVPN